MAKKQIKKAPLQHSNLFSCLCSWQESIFLGVVFFAVGFIFWAAAARILNPELMWAYVMMAVGILFAVKGAFFSYFKG